MTLPIYPIHQDPGPDFFSLLDKYKIADNKERSLGLSSLDASEFRHGTTVLAIKTADGVVVGGDRRATEANRIAYRSMEKVFAADSHSAIAIAGVAGPAVEMVKIFQIQLSHYEKVEGIMLSLEGKANQLGQMLSAHLPLAMQGLVIVPLYAGFDLTKKLGRIFSYDVTGGKYEEFDYATNGSGGRDARSYIKLNYVENMSTNDGIKLALAALAEAADEDSATGGIDLKRKIYPIVATVTSEGFKRLLDSEIEELIEI